MPRRLLANAGMLPVLLVLCAYFSWATVADQHPTGADGGERTANEVLAKVGSSARVLIIVGTSKDDADFAAGAKARLEAAGATVAGVVRGEPADARADLARLAGSGRLGAIACTPATAEWSLLDGLGRKFPGLGEPAVATAAPYRWPHFLMPNNLRNITSQIAVIAIIAIGMTLVIITGGIDLSVGSLVALSAVFAAGMIRDAFGGADASAVQMLAACSAAVAACALVGLFSGTMITLFGVPPFIVTLAVMQMAGGEAFIAAKGQSINEVPAAFSRLGSGADLAGIPNSVLTAALLYLVAHVVMTRMRFGRYVYAVGGNREAARLSGVPVKPVLAAVYALSGALAGLGGIITASQLKGGAPTYGAMYELQVIAAVVVGGTSLAGGEGRVTGTVIGALIIAVIQNGMNLIGVESYTQRVVFGAVILAAAVADRLRKR